MGCGVTHAIRLLTPTDHGSFYFRVKQRLAMLCFPGKNLAKNKVS